MRSISKVIKKAASIAQLLTADDQLENLRVIREAKNAVHYIFNKETKKMMEVPDTKGRLAATVLDLAYSQGLPTSTSVSMHGTFEDLGALIEKMNSSPEIARAVEEMAARRRVQETGAEKLLTDAREV